MYELILGLVVFLGAHSVAIVSPAWRDAMAAQLGARLWRALYSIVSIIGFLLIVHGYGAARLAPHVLYSPPVLLHYAAALLMVPVFPLLLAAYLPGRIKATVKHPMLTATKAWALAHLLANGALADVLLFGGFLAWAVADRISVGKRPPRAIAGAPPSRYNDAIAVIGGLVLYVVFIAWLHARWFGVSPLP
jgi:uncharacterized membrane protein